MKLLTTVKEQSFLHHSKEDLAANIAFLRHLVPICQGIVIPKNLMEKLHNSDREDKSKSIFYDVCLLSACRLTGLKVHLNGFDKDTLIKDKGPCFEYIKLFPLGISTFHVTQYRHFNHGWSRYMSQVHSEQAREEEVSIIGSSAGNKIIEAGSFQKNKSDKILGVQKLSLRYEKRKVETTKIKVDPTLESIAGEGRKNLSKRKYKPIPPLHVRRKKLLTLTHPKDHFLSYHGRDEGDAHRFRKMLASHKQEEPKKQLDITELFYFYYGITENL
jgi:hypothetical protein